MFRREVRTKLLQIELRKQNQEAQSEKAQTRDKKPKAKMKATADKQRSSSHLHPISVGDKVLVGKLKQTSFLLHTNPRHTLF